jgi:hypothetical protein
LNRVLKLQNNVMKSANPHTWGRGKYGQLGHGDTNNAATPERVGALKDAGVACTQAACGGDHTLAVAASGALLAWGCGASGPAGCGPTADVLSPVRVDPALLGGGGAGAAGAAGSAGAGAGGTTKSSTAAAAAAAATATARVAQVSAGSRHSMAVMESGALYSWGACTQGQLGHDQNPPPSNNNNNNKGGSGENSGYGLTSSGADGGGGGGGVSALSIAATSSSSSSSAAAAAAAAAAKAVSASAALAAAAAAPNAAVAPAALVSGLPPGREILFAVAAGDHTVVVGRYSC